MDLKQLQYFIVIAEEGQITAAAKRLNMAQPPLSQQLKHLEDELGTQLFERNTRRLQLSEAGRLFLARARQLVDLSATIKKEMSDYTSGYGGTVIVGITATSVPYILGDEMARFHEQYPHINFEFCEANTPNVLDLLRKGAVDIGIVPTPFHTDGLETLYKKPTPMAAVTTDGDNLAEAAECSVEDLAEKNIIVYRRYEALILEMFAVRGIVPRIICKCDHSYTALLCAEAGLGVAVLPLEAIKMAHKQMQCRVLTEKRLETSTVAVWLPNRRLANPARAFLDYFKAL